MNIRFRLRVWLPDRPDQVAQRHLTLRCRLCAAKRAMDMAANMETGGQRVPGTAKWEVSQIMGHLQGWQVVARSESARTEWVRRHGH